ncbi:glycosyltransferase [Vibrio sp. 10N.261.51.A4]|uniref:glycosyltransferase n=1 Tax=Vibrio sp. 10N.261.51.A4 TaxID=3229674 RepID=UPI00354C071B
MKKVIILTYDMIPYSHSFGGCQRMFFLADFLFTEGQDVTVIASKKIDNGNFGKSIKFKTKYYGDEVISNLSDIVTNNNTFTKVKSLIRVFAEKVVNFYFNEPSNVMAFKANVWLNKYKKDILDEISLGVDTVIISGPPFVLFSFVKEVKKTYPNVNVIIDYRDPWGLWNFKKSYAYIREKQTLTSADKIVVVTPLAKEETINHFKIIDKNKVDVIYNGYSDSVWKDVMKINSPKQEGKLKIAFVGAIDFSEYSYRDTSKLLRVYTSYSDLVELSFIGVEKTPATLKIMDTFPEINFITKVTQEESIDYMLRSDILLTLHTANDDSGKFLIQGKIFDYMKAKKPIWSIGALSDFSNLFILENNLGLVSENTVESINESLDIFLELKSANKIYSSYQVDEDFVMKFSRENQNMKYLDLL